MEYAKDLLKIALWYMAISAGILFGIAIPLLCVINLVLYSMRMHAKWMNKQCNDMSKSLGVMFKTVNDAKTKSEIDNMLNSLKKKNEEGQSQGQA